MNRRDEYLQYLHAMGHLMFEEVERHKWAESQKAGKDIGHEAAMHDWLTHHFPKWKSHQWQQVLSKV